MNTNIEKANQKLGAEETNTSENLNSLLNEPKMKDWFDQVDVSKVTRTLLYVSSTCLTSECWINSSLPGVLESTKLSLSYFIDLSIIYASFSNRHSPDLVRTENAKLDSLLQLDGSL